MNKRFGIFLFVLCVVAVVWLFTFRSYEITNAPPSGEVILAFGDSLVAGIGADGGNGFVEQTAAQIEMPIINLGVAGDTTADGLARIDTALAREPDVVLLLLGGNDALRRIPREETEENLRELIRRFQERGAVVVLLGVRGGLLGDPYNKMFENIARESGSVYIEDVLKDIFRNPERMYDQIHPNAAGYRVIAMRVANALTVLYAE